MSRRVIVIGGGIIGACCALYLRRAGCDVTLLEKQRFGAACSHGNCGYVCPSHVLPLAEPGAAWGAVRALFQKNSPFYIRPRADWQLWSWLLKFAVRCNEADMHAAASAIHALLQLSVDEYAAFRADGLECEWDSTGLLMVYWSQREFDAFDVTDAMLRERFGAGARKIRRDELLGMEPCLRPSVSGAWLYEGDAQIRPEVMMRSLQMRLEQMGVTIVEDAGVDGFIRDGQRAMEATACERRFPADAFVVATGAWTPLLERHICARVPIQPGKGYSITMPRPSWSPSRPMIFHERRVACSPFRDSLRLGSTMEFSGYDATLNRNRMRILTDAAREYLREPIPEAVEEEWFGWRPMTYDSLPIIGPAPALPNVYLAAGHSMLGVTLAPATGRLIADLVCERTPAIDVAPYSVTRFG